jgi:hypothetical protein
MTSTAASEDRLRLAVVCGPLAGPLVARVVGIAAARADLPIDRVEQALQVADAVAAQAPALLLGSRLEVCVDHRDARTRIEVGPLRADGARRLAEDAGGPAADGVIGRLATRTGVEVRDDSSEALIIDIGARPGKEGR